MKIHVYCLYDSKAAIWGQPVYYRSPGEFMRALTETVNDNKSNISKYSSDYTVFDLGVFDDTKGVFDLHKSPVSLGIAQEFKYQQLTSQLPPAQAVASE